MGGKVSSYKNKSFNWTRQRKKRSALFTRFLSVLLYTKNHDLIPNSILLDDIPFPTSTENWTAREYNIWSSLLNVLEIRSNYGKINKVELNGKNYIELKFVNEIYDGGLNTLIDYLRNDDYYWKKSQNVLGENFQSNFIIPRRPLSPVSFYSDYSLDIYDNLDILDDINNDIISFEKVDELLIRFQLQKDKFGMFSKGKNKSVSNIWIWKKSNRDSGIGEISVINFEN
ncbi:hypothetical protein RhiirA5_358781 [Rhizophagus irregularis]|jgi:hypothetical protein|uniref:Uncharacterized protein n=5 Tax=Rhizophagus irregularis TaxID=588596 RepID=A0A2I1ELQ0_9GLOM|nr:hypothetical protein GLOIN_2v1706681 [Rhizophagus irregularis DAOM 181602=DAOM 197198]EXX77300.1 hypothetical protein RirG_025060 [Rhizophagus irregularis DAOM 197198w]PKC07761.1 hypothetical protein RhiirA5_358781 [Rhizophagus irregularis]PKY23054.1 hypothetical protein RhiirB3_411349 [Rhizophagus irregularis]POG61101.1 hypothetical protein GLOIN_2v1706681 [Rhizophagus irregularis DAOM 181602=DAOM 197198]UZO15387.1 hypothetical protein OCT59_006814 [Rhizophagus irregularis]|eukprot:XP_025167967.1 hypothetical protein GLOIN_2v1706681 [Rhizophagus irregularis DAOM 181602=DAOM 197198]